MRSRDNEAGSRGEAHPCPLPRPGPHASPGTSLPLSAQGPVQPHPSGPHPQGWGTAVAVPALSWQYHRIPLCSKYQMCPRAEGTSCEGWGDGPWEGERGFLPSFCPGSCNCLAGPVWLGRDRGATTLKAALCCPPQEGGLTLCPSTGQQRGSSRKLLSLRLEPPLGDVHMQKDAS